MKTVEVEFLGKTLKLLQPETGFRTSLDSVMLASACPVSAGQTVMDLGCGVGGAALCLLKRVSDCTVHGIDIQGNYVELAVQNAAVNGFDRHSAFWTESVHDFKVEDPKDRYNHIICNPPYLEAGSHLMSPDEGKAIASGHLEEGASIAVWIKCALLALKSGGSLTIIHRSDALTDIIQALGKSFGQIEIIPLWPKVGMVSKRVIVRALKDRKSPLKLHSGLVLHEDDGTYTAKADAILKEVQSIDSVIV